MVANSFAAPYFSDTDKVWRKGKTARAVLDAFVKNYKHPYGLYWAGVWRDANAFTRGHKALAEYLSKESAARRKPSKVKEAT